MPFDTAVSLVSGALLLLGAMALALVEGDAGPAIVIVAIGVGGLVRAAHGMPPWLGRRAHGALALGALALMSIEYWVLKHDPLIALARFLVLIQALKVHSERVARDDFLLYIVGLIQLGLAGLVLFQIDFFLLLTGQIVVGVPALVLFGFRGAYERCAELDPDFRPPPVPWRAAVPLVGLGAAVAVSAVVVFVLMPRFGDGYQRLQGLVGRRTTGLSGRIDLNDGGSIRKSQRVVMRVAAEGDTPLPDPPLLRARCFDHYRDGRWAHSPAPSTYRKRIRPVEGSRFVIVPTRLPDDEPLYRLTFYLEPNSSPQIYTVGRPWQMQVTAGVSHPELRRDYEGAYSLAGRRGKQVAYTLVARPHDSPDRIRTPRRVRVGGRRRHRRYTQVPPNINRERLRQLARTITREAGATTYAERIRAVRDYLARSGRFTYTLDGTPTPPDGTDAIDHFLYGHRSGHCEFYAGAMCLLLRIQGIPCRVATGYMTHETNSVGRYLIVRERDAHAWVEVHFPGNRWLPFDPTPPEDRTTRSDGSWRSRLDATFEYLRMLWVTRVVSFGADEQRGVYKSLGAKLKAATAAITRRLPGGDGSGSDEGGASGRSRGPGGTSAVWLAIVGAGAVLALGAWWWRRRASAQRRPRHPLAWVMEALEEALPMDRAPGETHRELAARAGPAVGAATELVRLYGDYRYGGKATEDADREALESGLDAVRRAVRRE